MKIVGKYRYYSSTPVLMHVRSEAFRDISLFQINANNKDIARIAHLSSRALTAQTATATGNSGNTLQTQWATSVTSKRRADVSSHRRALHILAYCILSQLRT